MKKDLKKKIEKTWKKVLTNEKPYDILAKLTETDGLSNKQKTSLTASKNSRFRELQKEKPEAENLDN